jgi:hypothetical protein
MTPDASTAWFERPSAILLKKRKKSLHARIFQSDLRKITANPGCGNQRQWPPPAATPVRDVRGMKSESVA